MKLYKTNIVILLKLIAQWPWHFIDFPTGAIKVMKSVNQ